jgi:hypothetical protein
MFAAGPVDGAVPRGLERHYDHGRSPTGHRPGLASGHAAVRPFLSPSRECNVGQPLAGMVNEFRLKDEGYPYFAVTGPAGTFEIRDVPVGTQTIQV